MSGKDKTLPLNREAMRYTKTVLPTELHGITLQEAKMFPFTAIITSGVTNIKDIKF